MTILAGLNHRCRDYRLVPHVNAGATEMLAAEGVLAGDPGSDDMPHRALAQTAAGDPLLEVA